ncbi:MAG: hexokinase, partial [Treponema sp.]|nr:hexokinase [Treponema sp.]
MDKGYNRKELSDFARYYGFHYEVFDPLALMEDVLIDMERGLRGQASSLPMIPSYIRAVNRVKPGKRVLALDAGGTNLRASLVHFDEGGKGIAEGTVKTSMPGAGGRVSADEFFDKIAALAGPLLEKAPGAGIGFTFSYPMEITKEADGIPLAFSKEVDAPEVVGKSVGEGLRAALSRRKIPFRGPVVLLNDTAATLLSGLSLVPPEGEAEKKRDIYGSPGGPVMGLILGTGINTAYPEVRIPKIGFDSPEAPQIVVCETGTFALRHRGILDQEYDGTTKNPGAYTLEKAASGAYLGPLSLHILKRAVRDGLFGFERSGELLAMETLHTRDLNAFQHDPLAGEGPLGSLFGPGEEDALASVLYLASLVAERAGLFSAAVTAAAVRRVCSFGEIRPYAPVRIAV